MKDFKIFTDSTADLPNDFVQQYDITVIPTDVTIKGKTYLDFPDERELKKTDFYKMLREGEMPTTAVINPDRFRQYFEPVAKQGIAILYIVFSSGLTTTMQNATIAAEELKEAYPNSHIRIVDSRAASLGEGMLVYTAAIKKQEGMELEAIAEHLEAIRDSVNHWFTVDDLNHLRRGGRVTGTTAMIGGVLNVKPILKFNVAGKLVSGGKIRGRKAALEDLLTKIDERAFDIENNPVFFVHADCADECEYLMNEVKKRFGVKTMMSSMIGPVIGTHAGPGTISVFFFGKNKDEE